LDFIANLDSILMFRLTIHTQRDFVPGLVLYGVRIPFYIQYVSTHDVRPSSGRAGAVGGHRAGQDDDRDDSLAQRDEKPG
jgi:hypothetical protein